MTIRTAIVSALLASASVLCGPAALAEPVSVSTTAKGDGATVSLDYERFTLPNGLRVVVYSDTNVPNVYVGVRYRIGSRHEPAGRTGFAHLFEHLMFGPTANREGSYFAPLRKAGAQDINGSTTEDWTEYYEVVPAHALDLALWMESDRMQYLMGGVSQTILDEQRAVVKNEKRQRGAGPGTKAYERFLSNYYPQDHPYAHTVIGSMEDLDAATLDDVRGWYADYYGASNAVLVVSGNVSVEQAKERVAHYFSDVRPGETIDALDRWVPEMATAKRDVVHERVGGISIDRTWPVASADPRVRTMLQLAARTMAGTPESYLPKRLVDEEKVALSVSASLQRHDLVDNFNVSMAVAPGTPRQDAEAALDAALAGFLEQGPAQARIDAIHASSVAGLMSALDDPIALGPWLLSNSVEYDDPAFFIAQTDLMAETTPARLVTALRTVIDAPYFETVTMPEGGAQAMDPAVDRASIPDASPPTAPVAFPKMTQARLANGLRIVVGERDGTRTTTAALVFDTGSILDDRYAPGTAAQALGLLTAGTTERDRLGLQKMIGDLGGSLAASVGDRESVVTWTVPSERLADGFALASEVVRKPAYPAELVDSALRGIDSRFDQYEKNPQNAAGSVFSRNIWGPDNPRGEIATREKAKTLSLDGIKAFHDRELGPGNATLYVVGSTTPQAVEDLAKRYFGDWQDAGEATPLPTPLPAHAASGTIVLIDAPGAEQSTIVAGMPVAAFDKDAAAADSLMTSILGSSFASRMNTELRERRGWAYGFSGSIQNSPQGERIFIASGSVQTDKTADAMKVVRDIIAGYVGDEPATEAELEVARNGAVLSVPAGFSENADYLRSMAASASYGLPLDRAALAAQRLAAVSLADVRARAATLLDPDALTWVIVGDLSRIEDPIRKAVLGKVEVLDVYGKPVR
jgi:zinc protease